MLSDWVNDPYCSNKTCLCRDRSIKGGGDFVAGCPAVVHHRVQESRQHMSQVKTINTPVELT